MKGTQERDGFFARPQQRKISVHSRIIRRLGEQMEKRA